MTGETPPQSLMPASMSAGQRAGAQIRRRLNVHLRRKDKPGNRDRPQMLLERDRRHASHARPGLRTEVLDDDFLQMTVGLVQRAQRQQRFHALATRLADSNQDAGRERNTLLARDANRLQSNGRHLVRRSVVRPPGSHSRSDALSSMMPCEIDTRRSAARSDAVMHPGFTCGSSPVSVSTALAASARYDNVVSWPRRSSALARGGVSQLRFVSERKQHFLALRSLPRSSNLEHGVDRQVRQAFLSGRLREGAVVADVTTQLVSGMKTLRE